MFHDYHRFCERHPGDIGIVHSPSFPFMATCVFPQGQREQLGFHSYQGEQGRRRVLRGALHPTAAGCHAVPVTQLALSTAAPFTRCLVFVFVFLQVDFSVTDAPAAIVDRLCRDFTFRKSYDPLFSEGTRSETRVAVPAP